MVQVVAVRREDALVVLNNLVAFAPEAEDICLESGDLLLLELDGLVVWRLDLVLQLLLGDLILPVDGPDVCLSEIGLPLEVGGSGSLIKRKAHLLPQRFPG